MKYLKRMTVRLAIASAAFWPVWIWLPLDLAQREVLKIAYVQVIAAVFAAHAHKVAGNIRRKDRPEEPHA